MHINLHSIVQVRELLGKSASKFYKMLLPGAKY